MVYLATMSAQDVRDKRNKQQKKGALQTLRGRKIPEKRGLTGSVAPQNAV